MREAEKQRFIGEELIAKLSMAQVNLLRTYMNYILERMKEYSASDIEFGGLGARGKVWMRTQGRKIPYEEFGEFSAEDFNILIQSLLQEEQRRQLFDKRSADFSYAIRKPDGKQNRFRASAYFELGELALNMRSIDSEIRFYDSYGFHQGVTNILNLVHTKDGLVLVTGITGSGKSTTLDAIIDLNNRTINAHVVIIASPVEYVHQSNRCIIRHREVGIDTLSFREGTIEALRQDPDIIMIGEMRNPETIVAALEAADTGHKVFSTMHTSSAVESLDRIIGEIPSIEQERVRMRLADTLRCVISQKLVPSMGGNLVLAKEVLIMTSSIKAAIRNNNTQEIYQMISEGSEHGMCTMEQDLLRLFINQKISKATALNFSNNKRRMQQLMQLAM